MAGWGDESAELITSLIEKFHLETGMIFLTPGRKNKKEELEMYSNLFF